MQPSSLVFLVIIAVWAAYFVQYWVRRREHLATARSVDQFSESMRVLERRSRLPAANLSTPQPRSYAVTPARVARPQILVKRAEPASAAAPEPVAPQRAPRAEAANAPAARRTNGSSARRTRAVIMLGALTTLVVTVPLVALSIAPLLTLLVPVVAIAAAVGWARSAAKAQRRSSSAARPGRPRQSEPKPRAARESVSESVGDAVREAAAGPVEGTPEPVPGPVKPELFDVQAQVDEVASEPEAAAEAVVPAVVHAPARPLVDEDDIPLTWDPVPVPRPTYAMKSRVTRPAPTSADLVGDADTEYAAYDELPERRVAGA